MTVDKYKLDAQASKFEPRTRTSQTFPLSKRDRQYCQISATIAYGDKCETIELR